MKLPKSQHNLKPIVLTLITAFLLTSMNGCSPKKTVTNSKTPEVSVIIVKKEKTVISTELPGRTSPYLIAEVRPQVGGIVLQRLFKEGAEVKEGDILYQINPAPYQAIFDKSKAELDRAEARIISIKYKFERNKTLVLSHAISQQDFEISESDLSTAQAEIEAAKAAKEAAQINLDYTKVRASISGRIGKSHVTVGSLVTANDINPLATIQQIDPIFVDVVQSNADLLRFKQNIATGFIKKIDNNKVKVKLYLEDGSLYPLEGELKFRDITIDQSTGSFILRIVFPNPEYSLLPGMFVHAVIKEGVIDNAILVPHQAVSRNTKGEPIVYVVDNSNKVEEKNIVVDRSIGNSWLIKDGLNPGDKLIMEGFQRIRQGIAVKAVPFEPTNK